MLDIIRLFLLLHTHHLSLHIDHFYALEINEKLATVIMGLNLKHEHQSFRTV